MKILDCIKKTLREEFEDEIRASKGYGDVSGSFQFGKAYIEVNVDGDLDRCTDAQVYIYTDDDREHPNVEEKLRRYISEMWEDTYVPQYKLGHGWPYEEDYIQIA